MKTGRFATILALASVLAGQAGSPVPLHAQGAPLGLTVLEPGRFQLLLTVGGERHAGRVVEVGAGEVRFETDEATLVIPIDRILSVQEIPASDIRNGQYWFPNPNATRLFFAPTARMLPRGEGYFADYYMFFPSVAFGVSEHVTVGAGMSLFPGVGLDEQLIFFTPKVGFAASETTHLAVGALFVQVPQWDDGDSGESRSTVGILYGVGTYGSANSSATVGLGYGFEDGDLASRPMIMVGGEHRVSRRLSLVSENWVFPGVDQPLVSYGVRILGERLSVDLGFATPLGEDALFPGIPYVDFVVKL